MYISYAGWTSGESDAQVSITNSPKLNELGDLESIIQVWAITGRIRGDTLSALQTGILALETAFEQSGGDVKISVDALGATVAQQMLNANSVPQNIISSPVAYPKGDGNELANVRSFTVSIQGEIPITAAVGGKYSENVKYAWVYQNQKWTKTTSGSFVVANASDALTAFNAFLAANPAPAGFQREPYSYDENGSDVSFSITDKEYWTALPANVSSGGYTISNQYDGQSLVSTITGSFIGSGAEVAALAAQYATSGITISKSLIEDPYNGSWNFTYVRQSTSYNNGIVSETETVSITAGGADFHLHEQLEGEAVRAETVTNRIWRATQSGSKVGVGSYPTANRPKWTSDNNGKNPLKPGYQNTYTDGKKVVGGKINFTTSWNYSFEASRNIFTS